MLPNLAKDVFSTCIGNQFGCPVASSHQRIEPLQDCNTRFVAEIGGGILQAHKSLLVALYQQFSLCAPFQRLPDTQDTLPYDVYLWRGHHSNTAPTPPTQYIS